MLAACGSSGPTAIFYVDPPPATDLGCIGVAGFEVTISSAAKNAPSGPILNTAPTLVPADCHLRHSYSADDINIDGPATVTVEGHDGAGMLLVQGSAQIANLHAGPTHVELASAGAPLPILVIYRTSLGAPVSDIATLVVRAMQMGTTLLTVNNNPYFSVEPGAYAVPSGRLAPNGADQGLVLFVDATTTQGTALPRARRTASWKGSYYVAE
jgi:hypothetical protein